MLQSKVVVRNREDIGTRIAFHGQKFVATSPDGVLDPQPLPAIAEQMLKNPMFCFQGLENFNADKTKKIDESVTAPSPDAVRARVLAQTRASSEGPMFGNNNDLVRTMQRYQRNTEVQQAEEVEPVAYAGLANGQAPTPGMLRSKIIAAERMRDEFALKDAPEVEEATPVIAPQSSFKLDDDIQAQADALAALADLAEVTQSVDQPTTTDYAEMSLTQLRSIARDRKVPGWADMSQAKLVRALRNRE